MNDPFTPTFFRRLQQLKIRTRRAFLGSRQGSHRSVRKGHGLEFADFRAYAPGDDFRHIDWGVYGAPETFLINPDGIVLHKHLGPLTSAAWQNDFVPLMQSGGPTS